MVRFGVSIMLLFTALLAWAAEMPEDKQVIELVPKFGTVTFTHRDHSARLGDDCILCHHTYEGAEDPIQSCYLCHRAVVHREAAVVPAGSVRPEQAADAPPKAEHAFHILCVECHKTEREADRPGGPTDSCRDCHV
jgi:hypothetical protein